MSARRMGVLVIAVIAAVSIALWLHRSDEELVREAAEAIVAAANQDPVELTRALAEHASDDVSVTVSDLPEPLVGPAALVAAAARTPIGGRKLSFRMEAVDVSVEGNNARLNANFVATLRLGLRSLNRTRSGAALFRKIDGQFQLVSAELGAER